MAKNQEKTKNDIYNYFKSNGYEPVYKSTNGKEVSVPDEAEVIEFQFKVDGVNYGTAAISLDNEGQLKVFYSDKIKSSPNSSEHGETTWNELIPTLRQMTFGKTKSIELDDMDNLEYDMAKREHSKKLEEGYYPMGKKASYSDNIPECKIIIKHNRTIEEGEQRYRNIHQIFIENQLGERFLAPTTKPGLARVYARHIAEGGKVNDDKWNHITGLCEDYSKMAGFIRATRNGQFNEDTQRLVTAGTEHYISLRESLHKLAGKRGYNNYFESWTPPLMESEEGEDLSEMFMNSSLDPRIESVIPILNRLNKNISENHEIKEVIALEAWADSIAEGNPIPGQNFTTSQGAQMKWNPASKNWQQQAPVKPNDPYTNVSNRQTMNTKDVNGDSAASYSSTTTATDPSTGKSQTMTTTDNGSSLDDVDEGIIGKKKPKADRYSIVSKDGKPASLASYSDKNSAIKDRDTKHSGAKVHQVGPRGKVKGEFDESWQDDILAMAKKMNPNARTRGTPEQEKQRTMDTMAQRKKERDEQETKSAQQDFANIHELEAEYDQMQKKYKSLGGSNWQYADREQNLSDRERTARSMESALSRLGSRIALAKKVGDTSTLQHMQSLSGESGLEEDIGPQQKAVGQLGATAKVNAGGTILGNPERSQKGLRGKLVGISEMDKSQKGAPGWNISDDEPGGKESYGKAVKAKDVTKTASKILNKSMKDSHKKPVKEGQEHLDAIKRLLK